MGSLTASTILDVLLLSISRCFSYDAVAVELGEFGAMDLAAIATRDALDSPRERSWLVVALRTPKAPVGAFALVRSGDQEFTKDQLEVAEALAAIAATALEETARLEEVRVANVDLKREADRTTHLAYHDLLTGLPNRLLFGDRLKQATAQAPRRGRAVALLFVDLDGFKLINDSLGHAVGDRLLCGVAKRLTECVRSEDTVARLGGHEFALMLPSLDSAADAARVARKIIDRLRYSFECDGGHFYMTARIGISTSPEDGNDPETLIRKADTAMHQAKESGRNSYRFFKATLHRRALERLLLEKGLRTALSRNELQLYYQPIVDGRAGQLHGIEALLRWEHPELGFVPPSEFIPLAETIGALKAIEPWVLREACRQTRQWQELFKAPLSVSVNLSPPRVSEPDLPGKIASALADSKLPPDSLEIEITEMSAIRALDAATRNLRRVRATGVRISVDDFGTGYSSLGYLAKLPLDSLKVDRSFVRNIGRHAESAALVKAVIGLAHDLKLTTVAEGVETQDQLALLTSWNCDRIQGYLVAAPLPAAECESRLAALQQP